MQILSVSPGQAITIMASWNSYIITFPSLGKILQSLPITITNKEKTTYLFCINESIQTPLNNIPTVFKWDLQQADLVEAAKIFNAYNFNVIDFVKPLVNPLAD